MLRRLLWALLLPPALGVAAAIAAPARAGGEPPGAARAVYLAPVPRGAAPWPRAAARVPAALPALLIGPDGGAAAGAAPPVLVLLGDAGGFDERVALYAPALTALGIAVLALDPDGARGVDAEAPPEAFLPATPAEALHDALSALHALRHGGADPAPGGGGGARRRRVGLLGLGAGGEAAVLASFRRALAGLPEAGDGAAPGGGGELDAIAAVAPSCGPDLAAAVAAGEAPDGAPLLLVQPWAEDAAPARAACAAGLSQAGDDPALRERVSVLRFPWAGPGFDLPPLGPRAVLLHPSGDGPLDAAPEPGAAALALRAVAAFFRAALAPP